MISMNAPEATTSRAPWFARSVRLAVTVSLGAGLLAQPCVAAAADKKAECGAAYERSQELRASLKLHAARESLVVCAQGSCPSFIQSDCTQWLAELQREMPTVVVAAKNREGADAAGVKISIDGEPVEAEHEGSAIAVDPGRHAFRFELEGAPAIEREVVVRQGEKDRIIEVSFDSTTASTASPTPAAVAPPSTPEKEQPAVAKPGPLRPYAYVAGGIGAAGLIGFTVFGLVASLHSHPWYEPKYAIPLLGMILGNTMSGISLGLQSITTGLVSQRAGVEAQLMLGATRYEAMLPAIRRALRSALMPIINSMSVLGIVSLPGMMTGQILGGVLPGDAAKYQILIMLLIAGGTGIGAVSAVVGAAYRLSDNRDRLRLERLSPSQKT